MVYENGVSLPALAIGLCSIEAEGGGDGGGAGGGADGAAAALAAAAAGGGGDDAAAATAAAAAGGGGGAGGDPDWLEKFSAEGGDAENPSNRDWLKSKGFKTPDDLAKSYREAENAIRNGGKLTVPGENAKPEEVAAYRKAIGVPESVDGYEVKLPEDIPDAELDTVLIDGLREAALKAGVPKSGFEALGNAMIQHQVETLNAMKTAEDGDFGSWKKAQGDQANAKIADANTAMRHLGISQADVQAMQRGYFLQHGKPGSTWAMNLLSKLGAGMAEDVLRGGDGKTRFGITGTEAQAEIDILIKDREFGDKLAKKEPAAVARWDRLNAAVAADRDRAAAAAT